jgi:hypothetical protein
MKSKMKMKQNSAVIIRQNSTVIGEYWNRLIVFCAEYAFVKMILSKILLLLPVSVPAPAGSYMRNVLGLGWYRKG